MYSYVLNNPLNATDPTGLWCVWEDNTHDDDAEKGGANQTDCQSQGGHWDKSDSLFGVTADKNGNLTTFSDSSGIHSLMGGGYSLSQLDVDLAHANDPNAPQMSGVPKDCSFLGRAWDATNVSGKVGFAGEFGQTEAQVAGSYDVQSQSWSANADAAIYGVGLSASRTLTTGNQNPDLVDRNSKFSFSTPVTNTNVMTAQTTPILSGKFKIGVSVIVGGEASFDSAAFKQSGASCKQ